MFNYNAIMTIIGITVKLNFNFLLLVEDVPGKVFIGTAENDTTEQYIFSISQPLSMYVIPVYVDIYNDSTPVTVSCSSFSYIFLTNFFWVILDFWAIVDF